MHIGIHSHTEMSDLPSWVSPPCPACTAEARARNVKQWALALAVVRWRSCPTWNRSWRLACDIGPPLSRFGPSLDNGAIAEALPEHYEPLFIADVGGVDAPPPLVFVSTLALPAFIRDVLPRVSRRFVLVTGLADWGPVRVLGTSTAQLLVDDSRILAWWAEMCDLGGDGRGKVRSLPLGVDLHTLAFKRDERPGWGPPCPPLEQARALWHAASRAEHRDNRVHVFWGIHNRRRLAVSSAATRAPSVFAVDPAPTGSLLRVDLWARMGDCAWVACVEGYGIDCHRTWEALSLGCGVVVQDMPFLRECLPLMGRALFVPPPPPRSHKGDFSRMWLTSVTPAALADAMTVRLECITAATHEAGGAPIPLGAQALALDAVMRGDETGGGDDDVDARDDGAVPSGTSPALLSHTWMARMRRDTIKLVQTTSLSKSLFLILTSSNTTILLLMIINT